MASHEEVRPSTMRKYMKRQRLQKTYAFAACIKIQTEDEGIRLGGAQFYTRASGCIILTRYRRVKYTTSIETRIVWFSVDNLRC